MILIKYYKKVYMIWYIQYYIMGYNIVNNKNFKDFYFIKNNYINNKKNLFNIY